MIGLIVKGATALFLEGPDPGAASAIALINRYTGGNVRSWKAKLSGLNLQLAVRPLPLSRQALAWAYVFVVLTEGADRRLEPGPFDAELADVVETIEAERKPRAKPR
jgi:hypothetical protein